MNAAAVEVKPSARQQTHTMNTTICRQFDLHIGRFYGSYRRLDPPVYLEAEYF